MDALLFFLLFFPNQNIIPIIINAIPLMTLPYFQPSKTKDKSAAQKMTTKLTQPNICVPGKRKCSVKNKPNPIMYMIPTTGMKGAMSIFKIYAKIIKYTIRFLIKKMSFSHLNFSA